MSKRTKVKVRKAYRGTKQLLTELGTGAAYALKRKYERFHSSIH